MNFFSGNKEKSKLFLVFDLGSSSVGGALFEIESSGTPKILMFLREPIVLQENMNIDSFLGLTMKSLEVVADKILRSSLGAPAKIFCVLSAPWHVSQTRVIKLKKDEPFVFTEKLADELTQKEIAVFEQEYLSGYKNGENSIRSIELKNIRTMLNGYEMPNPINQKTKEVEMTIFISMSPEQILKKIEDTIGKSFHVKEIKFSSRAMAAFAVVRDMYMGQENFLMIDIGGEISDIFMVKKSILRESISFPIGLNFFIRGVANELKCSLAEAKSLISLFKDEHATAQVASNVGPIIDKLKVEWLNKFQESLVALSSDLSVPDIIYLAIDKDLANFFTQIIQSEQFSQYTLTHSKFQITFLDVVLFHKFATFAGDAVPDPGLIIDTVYINRFLAKI